MKILKYGYPLIGFVSSATTKLVSKKVWEKTKKQPAPTSPEMIQKNFVRSMAWGMGTALVSSALSILLKRALVRQANS